MRKGLMTALATGALLLTAMVPPVTSATEATAKASCKQGGWQGRNVSRCPARQFEELLRSDVEREARLPPRRRRTSLSRAARPS